MDGADHSGAGEVGAHGGEHGGHGGDHGLGFFGGGIDPGHAGGGIGDHHGGGNHGGHHGGHHGHGIGPHVGHHGIHGQLGHDANMADGRGFGIDAAPVTWLPCGLNAGFMYVKETYAHARAYGYTLGVDRSVPKGTLKHARMAQVVALDVARKIGGEQCNTGNYRTGYLFEHPSFTSLGRPAEGVDPGRMVNLPGIARNLNSIELLVWPHGQAESKKKLRNVMARLGAVQLDLRQSSSLPNIDKPVPEPKLLSANPFAVADDGLNPANGWFRLHPGDTPKGWTDLGREFYQLKGCWEKFRTGDKDISGVFIAVHRATWYFEASGDYETRIAFSIYALPYVSGLVPTCQETWKWEMIRNHRVVAEKAAATMFEYLSGFPASARSITARRRVRLENLEPEIPPARDPFDVPPTPLPVVPLGGGKAGDPAGPEADEKDNARK